MEQAFECVGEDVSAVDAIAKAEENENETTNVFGRRRDWLEFVDAPNC